MKKKVPCTVGDKRQHQQDMGTRKYFSYFSSIFQECFNFAEKGKQNNINVLFVTIYQVGPIQTDKSF